MHELGYAYHSLSLWNIYIEVNSLLYTYLFKLGCRGNLPFQDYFFNNNDIFTLISFHEQGYVHLSPSNYQVLDGPVNFFFFLNHSHVNLFCIFNPIKNNMRIKFIHFYSHKISRIKQNIII